MEERNIALKLMYNITVTGEQARGSVSFVRRDNSGL